MGQSLRNFMAPITPGVGWGSDDIGLVLIILVATIGMAWILFK